MLLTAGLTEHQLFQRGDDGTAVVACGGECSWQGAVEAEVREPVSGAVVAGRTRVGTAEGGRWGARIGPVPTGGPYTVDLFAGEESLRAGHVLVGDLWVLAGQSNMEGIGVLQGLQPPHPRVSSFDMADRWVRATEPLHKLWESVDPVHRIEDTRGDRGAGLGLPFAVEMVERTGVPVGLVPCAHGGTSMQEWDPDLRDRGGASLYGSLMRRVAAVGGRVRGVLWYQGESDAGPESERFAGRFERLIRQLRRDLDVADLPFFYVQLGRVISPDFDAAAWNRVQEAQRVCPETLPNTAVVPAVDLELDDAIHIGTGGLKRLGRRLAVVARRELFGENALRREPRFRGVEVSPDRGTVAVQYDGVNGALVSPGRPAGFSIRDAEGRSLECIYRIDLAGDRVLLRVQGLPESGAFLWYGHGTDPYCNVTDTEDMGVLVMGPVPV